MLIVVVALTIGPLGRAPPSALVTLNAETTATKTIEAATASSAIFPCVLPLALITEWFSI